MRRYSRQEFLETLDGLAIARGDIVHVQSDLRRIGPVDSPLDRESICAFYLDGLTQCVGPQGTITCCTSFEDYGRFGHPFIRETSPSRTDALSEYIRTREQSIRSLHPIVSVTGIGARAEEICSGSHFDGFGYDSPWGRLHQANAKILTLGLGANKGGTTFFHYVERLYGMPYLYTKIFDSPVFSGGKQIPGPFTMSVRYLDFDIVNTPVRIKNSMLGAGLARQLTTGSSESWCAAADDIVSHMIATFNQNRWAMLENPPRFRKGVFPMDGLTGELKEVPKQ